MYVMVRRLAWIAVLLGGCNARLGELNHSMSGDAGSAAQQDATVGSDAPLDAQPDAPDGPWGTPAVIPGTAGAGINVDDPSMTQDGLDIIYAVTNAAAGTKSLFEIQRASLGSPWGTPVPRTELDIGTSEESPRFSLDDKTIYYGVAGNIYTATRAAEGDAFGTPALVTAINTGFYQKWLAVCDNGVAMVARQATSTSDTDLYEGTLAAGAPNAATTLNSTSNEISTFLSKDCLTVYFASNRSGTTQLYTSKRSAVGGAWSTPVNVATPFSASDGADNEDPWASNDGHIFLLASERGGSTTKQLYISTR